MGHCCVISPEVCPLGISALTPPTTPAHGLLVVFPPPASVAALLITRGSLAHQTPLLKPVVAMAGDTVCVQDDGVFIAGHFVAPMATIDCLGRPLPAGGGA